MEVGKFIDSAVIHVLRKIASGIFAIILCPRSQWLIERPFDLFQTDLMEKLSVDLNYEERHWNFIQGHIRNFCMTCILSHNAHCRCQTPRLKLH